ncbi:hypothetical protein [Nocardia sp. NPDC050717]|uniref:hypothetical protein n=1 Tax=Nocardia sp. NPDC050717 TaxID=3157221 RepID=UPI00340AAD40
MAGPTRAPSAAGILVIPVLAFAMGVSLDGRGFVAAFLAGIAYQITDRDIPR